MHRPLRLSLEREQAETFRLALSSQGIASRLRQDQEGWSLWVAEVDQEPAAVVLETYERENSQAPGATTPSEEYGPTGVGIAMAALLVAFFVLTGPRAEASLWFERGSASAQRILNGEVWRTVTALTLHADIPHVASNAVFLGVFATAVCVALGPGLGSALVLLAGALGNSLNALLYGGGHSSVGASTAVFGAIGILGGLGLGRGGRAGRRKRWLPAAAALALLAMLGMGERTDVAAHFLGLLAGLALGWAAGAALVRPPTAPAQTLLLAGCAGAVLACWRLALQSS